MNTATLEINSALKNQLDHLTEESHRSENELANEALSLYLAQQRRITARIQGGLARTQRGGFVTDEEMGTFFIRHSDPTSNHRSLP